MRTKAIHFFVRQHIIEAIHLVVLVVFVTLIYSFSMLEVAKVSCITVLLWSGFLVLMSLDRRSVCGFSSLGTYTTLKKLNCFSKSYNL